MPLRHAVCSEIYQGWSLADLCRHARSVGYEGLEIAHFHLFENAADVGPAARAEMRRTIEGEGLACVGLHWLLVSPKGFHVTTNDEALRRRSWDYLARLVDLCGDLGGEVMVFGSPHQRATGPGWDLATAKDRIVEGLTELAPLAAARGVTVLMEAVPSDQGDVVTRLADAAEIVQRVGRPSVRSMFDTHNTADETDPLPALLERHWDMVRHVHVNEMDGRRPGTGSLDFASVLRVLRERDYRGWVSLEVFDFAEGSESIARESLRYLREIEASLG